MNEIEEYLLMIFLCNINENSLRTENVEFCQSGRWTNISFLWESFKKEELGRTLPEEFEFLATDTQLERIRGGMPFAIGLNIHKELAKNKIKITVVEND